MAHLVRIGNSLGIRIPKSFIDEADLKGKEFKFSLLKEGLLIVPIRTIRRGWKEAIEAAVDGDVPLDQDWIDAPLVSEDEWHW